MTLSECKVPFIQLLQLEKNQQLTKSTYSTGVIKLYWRQSRRIFKAHVETYGRSWIWLMTLDMLWI